MEINYLHSFPMHRNKDIGIFFLHAVDVWFSLNNTTYRNNSLVTLEGIGENNASLLCMSNLTACCRSPYSENLSASGNWFFPNKSRVPNENSNSTIYRTRSRSKRVEKIQMHHRRGGVEGIYRCEIPDSMNAVQTIYIGVYNTSTGKV